MYQIIYSNSFKKNLKTFLRNTKFQRERLEYLIYLFTRDSSIPPQFKNHKLQGKYRGLYECHLYPDILLIYDKDRELELITLMALGSHSELFD